VQSLLLFFEDERPENMTTPEEIAEDGMKIKIDFV
jgi:hypothetical protein